MQMTELTLGLLKTKKQLNKVYTWSYVHSILSSKPPPKQDQLTDGESGHSGEVDSTLAPVVKKKKNVT